MDSKERERNRDGEWLSDRITETGKERDREINLPNGTKVAIKLKTPPKIRAPAHGHRRPHLSRMSTKKMSTGSSVKLPMVCTTNKLEPIEPALRACPSKTKLVLIHIMQSKSVIFLKFGCLKRSITVSDSSVFSALRKRTSSLAVFSNCSKTSGSTCRRFIFAIDFIIFTHSRTRPCDNNHLRKRKKNQTHQRDEGVADTCVYLADSGTTNGVAITNSSGTVVYSVKARQSPAQIAIHGVKHIAVVKNMPIEMLETKVRHFTPVYSKTAVKNEKKKGGNLNNLMKKFTRQTTI